MTITTGAANKPAKVAREEWGKSGRVWKQHMAWEVLVTPVLYNVGLTVFVFLNKYGSDLSFYHFCTTTFFHLSYPINVIQLTLICPLSHVWKK